MNTISMSRDNLIRWLDGDWALQFSHPEDFACTGLEADRWLVVVRDAFAAAGVRPLAARSAVHPVAGSWVTGVGGILVGSSDLPAPAGRRVVTVLDDALNARRQFFYDAAQSAPSPLDLVSATWMLRTAPRAAGRSAEARDPRRQELFIGQIWRGAREVTAGAARAVQLDAALSLARDGLLEVAGQVDRHLVQSVRAGLQRGLRWLGHEPASAGDQLPPHTPRSLNGGW